MAGGARGVQGDRRFEMLYTKQVPGSVKDVLPRLEAAAKEHRFGVLGSIDLKARMTEKGVPFDRDCVILEVCNPEQARTVLEQNPAVSTALPCRISVYQDGDKVTVATVRPTALLKMYEGSESLAPVARQVEDTVVAIIDQACG
jgi:uncharacterized protein (DUF302 family)